MKNYMWEEPIGVYRTPTEAELSYALRVQSEREEINRQLDILKLRLHQLTNDTSKVFYDEGGHLYDIRHYVASGKTDLI